VQHQRFDDLALKDVGSVTEEGQTLDYSCFDTASGDETVVRV